MIRTRRQLLAQLPGPPLSLALRLFAPALRSTLSALCRYATRNGEPSPERKTIFGPLFNLAAPRFLSLAQFLCTRELSCAPSCASFSRDLSFYEYFDASHHDNHCKFFLFCLCHPFVLFSWLFFFCSANRVSVSFKRERPRQTQLRLPDLLWYLCAGGKRTAGLVFCLIVLGGA